MLNKTVQEQIIELLRAIVELENSADNTGCTDDLTVVEKEKLDEVTELASWIASKAK